MCGVCMHSKGICVGVGWPNTKQKDWKEKKKAKENNNGESRE